MKDKVIKKALLDAGMLVVFVLLMYTALTGVLLHEILGVLLMAMVAVHLVLNKPWLQKALHRNRPKAARWRLNAALNAVLALSGVVVIASGVMISQYLFRPLNAVDIGLWTKVHGISATVMLSALLAHGALHLNWIRGMLGSISRQFGRVRAAAIRVGVGLLAASAVLSLFLGGSNSPLATQTRRNDTTVQRIGSVTTTAADRKDSAILSADSGSGAQDQVTLAQFLSNFTCTACHRHCPLSSPRCGRAQPQIQEQTQVYNETYGVQQG